MNVYEEIVRRGLRHDILKQKAAVFARKKGLDDLLSPVPYFGEVEGIAGEYININVPIGIEAIINGQEAIISDGVIEFMHELPGEYEITLKGYNEFKTTTFKVVVS